MKVQIIESNRGGEIAVHDGHQKQTTNNYIHYWRCTKYYNLKCPAILKTKNETVIETKRTHNHACDPGECKAKEVVDQIKRSAQYYGVYMYCYRIKQKKTYDRMIELLSEETNPTMAKYWQTSKRQH